MTMQVKIQVDYEKDSFTVIGKPEFYLHEAEKIKKQGNGQYSCSYNGASQRKFSSEEWKIF